MKINHIDQNFQKETNLSIVLHALRSNSECTRIRLSELTGLAQASITKIIANSSNEVWSKSAKALALVYGARPSASI